MRKGLIWSIMHGLYPDLWPLLYSTAHLHPRAENVLCQDGDHTKNPEARTSVWERCAALYCVIFLQRGDEVSADVSRQWVTLSAVCRSISSPLTASPSPHPQWRFTQHFAGLPGRRRWKEARGSERAAVRVGRLRVRARAGLRQAGSGIPYRCLSVCLLHSSPPSFLRHPPSLHFSRTKVADKDEAAWRVIGCRFRRGEQSKLRTPFVSAAACFRSQISKFKTSRCLYVTSGSLNFELCNRYLKHSGTFVLPDKGMLAEMRTGFFRGHDNKGFLNWSSLRVPWNFFLFCMKHSGVHCVHWGKYFRGAERVSTEFGVVEAAGWFNWAAEAPVTGTSTI